MKPLVALYKTYRGGEWFEASLESVHEHCVGIVVVASRAPWKGVAGEQHAPENCLAPLERFKRKHPGCEVLLVDLGIRLDTEQQYGIGLNVIKQVYGMGVGVLIVDTDEVWTDEALGLLRRTMTVDVISLVFRSGIRTYLRSPLYQVFPQERARPVVGLANCDVATGSSRFANLPSIHAGSKVRDVPCDMHHFGYVRLDPEEIVSKMENTASQDKARPRQNWKQKVWDELPLGHNLHPVTGFEGCWESIVIVSSQYLPTAVVESSTFWATLAYHPSDMMKNQELMKHDEDWRAFTEKDEVGVETTVADEYALCLSAALDMSQDDAIFLTPRLRMSLRETMQLAEHAKQMPQGGTALEIGSGLGGSLSVIGCCSPDYCSVVAVDPFKPYDEDNTKTVKDTLVGTVEEFRETMKRMKVVPNLMQTTSAEAIRMWSGGGIDLLLVDGNHTYDHALYDMSMWWQFLKPGGLLLVHDFSGRFPGVVRAAREFEDIIGLKFNLPRQSTLAWIRKPEVVSCL